MAAAGAFNDLAKFYEHVSHDELRAEARASDFNLRLLRALVCGYRQPRRAVFHGAISSQYSCNGTIAAGCSCALTLAKCLFRCLFRRVLLNRPTLRLLNIVDDVALFSVGGTATVTEQLTSGTTELLDGFEAKRLKVSWNKTGYIANSKELAQELDQHWVLGPGARATSVRDLGTDATDARRRRIGTTAAREEKSARCSARVQVLRNAGCQVGRIQRASPTAMCIWGSAVAGLPDGRLNNMRLRALRAEGKVPPGVTLNLRMRSYRGAAYRDPLVLHSTEVAKQWRRCLWLGIPGVTIQSELTAAASDICERRAPWQSCKNPAEAFVLAMARIGIEVQDALHVRDHKGEALGPFRSLAGLGGQRRPFRGASCA